MQSQQQLTPTEYSLLLELVYAQRNPLFWQGIKQKLVALSEGATATIPNTVTSGDRATYGGGSKPSNIGANLDLMTMPLEDIPKIP